MAAKRRKPADETLTVALARLLEKTILPDLADRAKTPAVADVLREQHAHEKENRRTADPFEEWAPRWLEQIGAAWILSCVFLRTLEDRGLVRHRRIAGTGAADAEQLFFELAPSLTARDYLLTAFREVARYPGAEDLLGPSRNPAFRLSPSNDGARALLDFFRQPGEGGQGLRFGFEGKDTRFLGDLYQDLSASVRERYALLQTPVFVEEFILDLTLEPAIKAFGLEETHVIDPTCGSGHFLLGAFERLCEHRMRVGPGVEAKEIALAALGQVHGVDLNPYAVAIARFRLTLAYLDKAGLTGLWEVGKPLPLNVAVADSLLHGAKGATGFLSGEGFAPELFALEDQKTADKVLGMRYQAVVGNPPYITCKDAALREAYREQYVSAAGKYALAAPFTERFFQLAVEGGYVGLINANSFMKREFGKKLIEEVLKHLDLTRVVDTSGAYIPGHGTPTVLLFGRNQRPVGATVRAVLGKKGEPETPADATKGKVWSGIADHFDETGFENEFVSVAEMPRETFCKHPWSVGGGGAADLKERLELGANHRLEAKSDSIGIASFTLEDDVYLRPPSAWHRERVPEDRLRTMIIGEAIRDWSVGECEAAFFPYNDALDPVDDAEPALRALWTHRTNLANNKLFGGKTKVEGGLHWYEFGRLTSSKLRTPLTITFAFVATHNHFVLDRGGQVFKQSAPIIKLPEDATEDDHLALLAYLNSSTACFWMKQVCTLKANHTEERPEKGIPDWGRYEFAGTAISAMPIPSAQGLHDIAPIGQRLDALARARQENEPSSIIGQVTALPNEGAIASFFEAHEVIDKDLLHQMVCLQEDLDWAVYAAFGLCDQSLARSTSREARLTAEQRPFLAEPPSSLGEPDAALFVARRKTIANSPQLTLMENLVNKRKWMGGARGSFALRATTYRDRAESACVDHVLAQIEQLLAANQAPMTARALRDALGKSASALLTFGDRAAAEADAEFVRLLSADAIPYLAAHRHTEPGLAIHAHWLHTWALQRQEDAGNPPTSPIPVPPKYDAKDFRDPSYYRLRGKLDVPKERFIAYPGAEREDDRSPLFGWAGWDHLQRATALATLYQSRKTEDGWQADRLTPLLAGLLELVPWLKQWHNELNEDFGERLGDYYERYVDTEAHALGLTLDALRAWRPEARGRKSRAKPSA